MDKTAITITDPAECPPKDSTKGENRSNSPLSRAINDDQMLRSFQKKIAYHSHSKNTTSPLRGTRVHPNSHIPTMARSSLHHQAPSIGTYMPKQHDVNKVARYVNHLSNRLSIPKLRSNDS